MDTQSPFFAYNTDFTFLGAQHVTVVICTILLCIGLPILGKRYLNMKQQLWISRILAVIIFCWVILYIFILLYLGKFNYQTDLPFDICNLMGLLLPFVMWSPSQKVFPYFYFLILTGTSQAVITPHLFNGFPNFIFIKYWIVHSGLVIYIIYVAVVWGYHITWKDFRNAFFSLQAYVVFVFALNKLIGSNYVYVVRKPPTASALDFLGPWPIYILVCELIFLFLSFMVYLPYLLSQKT